MAGRLNKLRISNGDENASSLDSFSYGFLDSPDTQASKALGRAAASDLFMPDRSSYESTYFDPNSPIGQAVQRIDGQLLKETQKWNALDLNKGKEDEEGKVDQLVAQAILAFAPIVGGYIAGGDKVGAFGAQVGLNAQRQYQGELERDEAEKEQQIAAQKKQGQQVIGDLLKRRDQLEMQGIKTQEKEAADERKFGPGGLLENYNLRKQQLGLGSRGTTVNVDLGSAMQKIIAKQDAKAFASKRAEEEERRIELRQYEKAIDKYLAANPEARSETNFDAITRRAYDSLFPDEAASRFASQRAMVELKNAATLVKGAASDKDQVRISNAVLSGAPVRMQDLLKLVREAQVISLRNQAKMREEVQMDPLAVRPYEIEESIRLGVPLPKSTVDLLTPEQKVQYLRGRLGK